MEHEDLILVMQVAKLPFVSKLPPTKIKSTLDFNSIVELRLARKNELVKILGRGELKAKVKVSAHKFTATAKASIEAAGGEVITI